MLKTNILASSITNLTDARYFAAWEVEWLGFNFDEVAADFIPPQGMKAIRDWVAGVKIIGCFGSQSLVEIETATELLELDAVQLGMLSDLETTRKLSVPVIKEIVVGKVASAENLTREIEIFAPYCTAFLLNFAKNGICWKDLCTSKVLPSSFLKTLCQQYEILLDIDLSIKILKEMLPYLQPYGILLKGGVEEKTGFKSFDELDEIFEWLEE